ncbi:hypothetical protein CTAYLR_004452 [Chrysophaeum taylorii]|uniref:Uncharacterized protein n=1 Tax=Chrysophaeum taylorii TaxID=2483200 RepID=A0AAD7UCW3_9STRA|nr:hypothetical protein CTAYLR_004452 [Chrysophaeum taylorii]
MVKTFAAAVLVVLSAANNNEQTGCPSIRVEPRYSSVGAWPTNAASFYAPVPRTECPAPRVDCLQPVTVVVRAPFDERFVGDLVAEFPLVQRVVVISPEPPPPDLSPLFAAHEPLVLCGCDADPRLALESETRLVVLCDATTNKSLARAARTVATPLVATVDDDDDDDADNYFATLHEAVREHLRAPDVPSRAVLGGRKRATVLSTVDSFEWTAPRPVDANSGTTRNATVHAVWATTFDQLAPVVASVSSAVAAFGSPDRLVVYVLVPERVVGATRAALECALKLRRPADLVVAPYETAIEAARRDAWVVFRDKKSLVDTDLATDANFVRMYLPSVRALRERRARYVVWLDADTIVKGDLGDMLAEFVEMQTAMRHAKVVAGGALRTHPPFAHSFRDKSNWPPDLLAKARNLTGCSFNAGVMIFDLDNWQALNMTARLEEWMVANAKYRLWDGGSQPPLMLATRDFFAPLDPSWNVCELGYIPLFDPNPPPPSSLPRSPDCPAPQPEETPPPSYPYHAGRYFKYEGKLVDATRTARILHWSGRFKPWHVVPPAEKSAPQHPQSTPPRSPLRDADDDPRRRRFLMASSRPCTHLCNRALWIHHGHRAESMYDGDVRGDEASSEGEASSDKEEDDDGEEYVKQLKKMDDEQIQCVLRYAEAVYDLEPLRASSTWAELVKTIEDKLWPNGSEKEIIRLEYRNDGDENAETFGVIDTATLQDILRLFRESYSLRKQRAIEGLVGKIEHMLDQGKATSTRQGASIMEALLRSNLSDSTQIKILQLLMLTLQSNEGSEGGEARESVERAALAFILNCNNKSRARSIAYSRRHSLVSCLYPGRYDEAGNKAPELTEFGGLLLAAVASTKSGAQVLIQPDCFPSLLARILSTKESMQSEAAIGAISAGVLHRDDEFGASAINESSHDLAVVTVKQACLTGNEEWVTVETIKPLLELALFPLSPPEIRRTTIHGCAALEQLSRHARFAKVLSKNRRVVDVLRVLLERDALPNVQCWVLSIMHALLEASKAVRDELVVTNFRLFLANRMLHRAHNTSAHTAFMTLGAHMLASLTRLTMNLITQQENDGASNPRNTRPSKSPNELATSRLSRRKVLVMSTVVGMSNYVRSIAALLSDGPPASLRYTAMHLWLLARIPRVREDLVRNQIITTLVPRIVALVRSLRRCEIEYSGDGRSWSHLQTGFVRKLDGENRVQTLNQLAATVWVLLQSQSARDEPMKLRAAYCCAACGNWLTISRPYNAASSKSHYQAFSTTPNRINSWRSSTMTTTTVETKATAKAATKRHLVLKSAD